MKRIDEVKDFEGKSVIVRVDWNVPINESGEVVDDSRIKSSKETIDYILQKNGRAVVLSHFGRKGDSIKPVFDFVSKSVQCVFVDDPFTSGGKEKIQNLKVGEIAMVENIRKWVEEEGNDDTFAKNLASLGNFYVNEAFSASHRAHASIVGIPQHLPHFAGFHFVEEVSHLSKAFSPAHPFLFILGGAKFDTKIPLVEKFLNIADHIFIGGAIAREASTMGIAKSPKVSLPIGDVGALDANEETLNMLEDKIKNAKFILWNGPLGKYEDGYTVGTKKLVDIIINSGVETIVGGGDTLVLLGDPSIRDKFSFVSVAGGATLDYLSAGTLPGIEALN